MPFEVGGSNVMGPCISYILENTKVALRALMKGSLILRLKLGAFSFL